PLFAPGAGGDYRGYIVYQVHSFELCTQVRSVYVALGLAIFSSSAFAQTTKAPASPAVLKQLSVEELMEIEVTSVSKRPEKLSETASAIQDDVRSTSLSPPPAFFGLPLFYQN